MFVLGSANAAVAARAQARVPAATALIVSIVSLPLSKSSRPVTPAPRFHSDVWLFMPHVAGVLRFSKLDGQGRQTWPMGSRIDQSKPKARANDDRERNQ